MKKLRIKTMISCIANIFTHCNRISNSAGRMFVFSSCVLVMLSAFFTACKEEAKKDPPTISTLAATDITSSSATLGGNISYVGNPVYMERGICYSTSENPTISDTKVVVAGSGTGNFPTNITGLTVDNTYLCTCLCNN